MTVNFISTNQLHIQIYFLLPIIAYYAVLFTVMILEDQKLKIGSFNVHTHGLI